MEHVLDSPAWNALISGNQDLANGTSEVKYFDKEVSPFIGIAQNTPEYFHKLYDVVPHNGPIGFVTANETDISGNWKLLNHIRCFQMICENPAKVEIKHNVRPLTIEHVPQMLALTELTKPGPFGRRTIEFGHYHGIFDGERLVAMAGQRMHIFNYAEISAVCTHPDYLGRGYAKELLLFHINRIKAANEIPVLHVREDNERAIKVYESIGFKSRCIIHFYILTKV